MNYTAGTDVTLEFNLDLTGEVDTIAVSVEDELGAIVASLATANVTADEESGVVTVVVKAAANTLSNGATSGHRVVTLTYTADEFIGKRILEIDYALLLGAPLQVQVNSFQIYNQALMTAAGLQDIAGFNGAVRQDRINALKAAWVTLCGLTYFIEPNNDQTRIVDAPGRHHWDLGEMTEAELLGLDDRFLAALYRAQVVEANELISGGGAQRRRMDGILSSTIGETSQMFRTGKPVEYAVSPRTLRELRGYVSFAKRLGRA